MFSVTMPQPSHCVTDGMVTHWYKQEGERVEEGEPLLEIETIKSTQVVLAPAAGVVARIHVREGVTVACETLLAEVEEE